MSAIWSAQAATSLVVVGWTTVVLGWAWRRRPAPPRLRAVTRGGAAVAPPTAMGGHQRGVPVRERLGRLAEAVGAAVARRTHRPVGPAVARRLGTAILTGVALLPVLAVASIPAGLVVWAVPGVRARRRESQRLAALAADLPDVVDLLVLAVGSGLTVNLAVRNVADRAPGPLGAELRRAGHEADLGRRLGDALADIPARAGEATRPLVAALLASERYGAPLGAGLERLALEVRADRRRRAEEAARKIPVKLLFPLVTCTLPAFALLTVAPLIASALRSLRL